MQPLEYRLPCDNRACVCSVCTCGNHKCPGLYCMAPLQGTTSYRDTFTPKKAPKDEAPKKQPPPLQTKPLPGQWTTTYQNATEPILEQPPERREAFKPPNNPPPPAVFEGQTTQRTDFPGHQPKVPLPPPKADPLPKLPGTYDTTLGAMQQPIVDALKKGNVPYQSPIKNRPPVLPHLPFDGITSYTVHYPPKANEPASKSPRKIPQAPNVQENRDFTTTKQASYIPPPKKPKDVCPAALVPVHPASRDGHIKVENEEDLWRRVSAIKNTYE